MPYLNLRNLYHMLNSGSYTNPLKHRLETHLVLTARIQLSMFRFRHNAICMADRCVLSSAHPCMRVVSILRYIQIHRASPLLVHSGLVMNRLGSTVDISGIRLE